MGNSNLDTDFYESEDPIWNPALLTIPVPGIRRMVNLAADMDDVIHLSIGQPDFKPPEHVIQAGVDALYAGQTGYTMDAGLPELLDSLAEYYSKRYQRTLVPENFLVTTGATEALYLALTATSAPGREFIVPDPSFMLYGPLIRMNGGIVRSIATRAENNHQLDPQEVIDAMGPNTFAVILNSPSNPTGTIYPRETIDAIVEEAAYRGIHVISDEVYDHLIYDGKDYPSVLSSCPDLDHVMVISSFSKTFSMAGMRVAGSLAAKGRLKNYAATICSPPPLPTPPANGPALRHCVAAINSSTAW